MLISDTAKEISLVASAASYTLLVKTLELVKSEEDLPLSGGKQIEFLFYMDSAKQMSEIAKNMFELGSSARKEAFDMMEYVDNHTDLFSSGNLTKKDVKAS
jgi:hypothetical protein